MLRPLLGERVDLRLELGESAGAVEADPGQLEQVLTNLVVNARDSMPAGGCVTITTASAEVSDLPLSLAGGSCVAITVTDNGEGMNEEARAHALEPFFTTKEHGMGTGLGLATVHGIVTQSGGDLRIVSAPGEGTSVVIYLPSTSVVTVFIEEANDLAVLGAGETILLIEDDRVVQTLLADVLTKHGYDVIVAADAAEALATAASLESCGDLILTDMVMPGLSGRELVEELRELDPDVSVIYMSGYTQDAALYEDAESGRVDFLQKPFSPATLLQTVRVALDRPADANASLTLATLGP
jgi:CheY-like chemotaxis protein